MALLYRILSLGIGAAFAAAVANLVVTGLPGGGGGGGDPAGGAPGAQPAEALAQGPATAKGLPGAAAAADPGEGATLRDVLAVLLSGGPEATGRLAPAHLLTGGAPLSAPPSAPPSAPRGGPGVAPETAPETARAAPRPAAGSAAAVEAAWATWVALAGPEESGLVVLGPGDAVHRAGAAEASVPLAEVSTMITGLCLDLVLEERGLGWDTTLGEIAAEMSALDVTPQDWNRHLALGSFATHGAGVERGVAEASIDPSRLGALGLHRRIAWEGLRAENLGGPLGDVHRSAANYAILGVVIEALTGQSYAEACRTRVVTPAGAAEAVIEGRMGALSSFGGWEMSALDLARVARHWLVAGHARIDDPEGLPLLAGEGPGYRIEGAGAGARVTQGGGFCPPGRGGTGAGGAQLLARGDGVVAVATWRGCLGDSDTAGLREALAAGLR